MMRRVTVSMCLLALIGCAGKAPPADSAGGPAKHPPAVPPMVATPIDEMLRAQAKEELTTEVKSSDELLRAHALEEMKQQRLPEAESIIVAALADRSSLVRKAAALAAGELQVQGATDRLSQALDTAAPNDRIALIFALHRLGDTSHSHELERTAVDPDARLRGDTALVLGMLGDKSSVPILLNLLVDPDRAVRLEAAEALWKLGNDRGLESLVSATISADPDERMIALLSLAEPHDMRVLGNVEGRLTDDEATVALVAARAAGVLGTDDGYGVALAQVRSNEPRLRAMAAIAFGDIGRRDAQPILRKLLSDSDANVRLAAAGAILEIGQKK